MTDKWPLMSGVASPPTRLSTNSTLDHQVAQLSEALDGAPIGVGVWSRAGTLLHANPVLRDLLERPTGSLVGEPIYRFLDEADIEQVRAAIVQLAAGDRNSFDCELGCHGPDGQDVWLTAHVTAVYGVDGQPGVLVSQIFDFTDAKTSRSSDARLFRRLIDDGPLALARCDASGDLTFANRRWASIFQDPQASLGGRNWQRLLVPEHLQEIRTRALESAQTHEPFTIRVRALYDAVLGLKPDQSNSGTQYWAELTIAPTYEGDEFDGWVATLTDVSGEIAAGSRADQLARVLDAGSDYLMIAQRNLSISYVNNAASKVLGVTVPPGAGRPPPFLVDVLVPESFEQFQAVIEPALVTEGIWRGELTFSAADDQHVPVSVVILAHTDEAGRIESISAVARDITDLKAAQAKLEELATHDYLTGLPNRILLYDRLEHAVARFQRYGQPAALLYLDLDHFKPVNDVLGHNVGDAVLVKIADRIHAVVRDTDTAARLGGDEFAVLVEGISDPEMLREVASRLIRGVSAPITINGADASVGVSVGLVVADEGCSEPDALMALADTAVYRAKATGRGRFVELDADGHEVGE